jgi:DNA-binding transcriptional regulator GbsR (MarR family)
MEAASAPEPVPAEPVSVDEARARAQALVADTLAELMRFWNFKPSMGRIWAVLYLSREPLDAEQIERATDLSAGMVSTTLQELQAWGVVRKVENNAARVATLDKAGAGKRRTYEAETDILSMVARVFRERELALVDRSIAQLEEALRLLEGEGKGTDAQGVLHSRFLVTRVSRLLDLARTGRGIVQQLAGAGRVDLSALRDALAERVRGRVGGVVGRVAGRLG